METQLSITPMSLGKNWLQVQVPYGERPDSFCDRVVRGRFVFDPEAHPLGLVVSLVTTDFVKKPMAILGCGVPNTTSATHCLAGGWLGQYNRKHRKENEIAEFPQLAASDVCL